MERLINWWQHLPEQMNPVLLQIGGFAVHYYGLMYLVAFTVAYFLCRYRMKHEPFGDVFNGEKLQGLFSAGILGLILGARLGYVLFYNLSYYLRHPLEIILPFDIANGWRFIGIAGMSYHGGLIGAMLLGGLYCKRNGIGFRRGADFLLPCIPLGYTFGRLGNFINGELWGRRTERAIGMYFPDAPGEALRHPSQLYEAFFEGIVLFGILWFLRKKMKVSGSMATIYLVGYGFFRLLIEYVREPDAHLGYIAIGLSMGQLLCIAMILTGLLFYWWFYRLQKKETG